jgi:hypothetical protein
MNNLRSVENGKLNFLFKILIFSPDLLPWMDTQLLSPPQLHSCLAPNSVQFPYFCKVSQFTSIGTGNGQGNRYCRYWCYKNPHAVHDDPVHDHKLELGVQRVYAKSEGFCFLKKK